MRWWHLLFPLALAGCGASALSRCQSAEAGYAVAQVAIEAAVTSPTITPERKAALQQLDRVAIAAIGVCEAASKAGDEEAAGEAAITLGAQVLLASDLTGTH